ncbi:MAG: aldehyde dehydrogenase family protein [Thermoplasmataceae archaeon]|jgi:1-pyrroline-5-carboxylate dehydrogenase
MTFENELTYVRMTKGGKEKEFHDLYEKALKDAEKYLNKEYPNIIGTEIIEKEKLKDISPIDGKEIGTFQAASEDSVRKAISMLKSNYKKWYHYGYRKRASIILKAADLLSEKKFLISALLAYENGKNRTEAMADVDEGIDFLRYYAFDLIQNNGYERLTGKGYDNEESFSVMKPYGVFAVIPPFNFFAITVGMTAAPLVAGNGVILKASGDIPISTYLTVNMLYEAGVPKEALAFVAGKGSVVGKMITEDDDIGGVVFTGSREVGMGIYRNAQAKRPKPVITEMGGKDAVIVSNNCRLDDAVEGVFRGAYGYSGQKCSATSLAYVHRDVYDEFVKKLSEKVRNLKPEDPRKKEAFLNPVVNREAYERFKNLTPKFSEGGKVVAGGKALDQPGFYVEATLIADAKPDSHVVREELFLPVLAVLKVNSVEEAVEHINKSEYGLTGGIFTNSQKEMEYYFDNVEAGVIYANRTRGASTGAVVGSQPFVGWKMSGISGKGTGSYYYLQQFMREQSQTIAHSDIS